MRWRSVSAHEWVLSKRREEKPSGKPLCLGHRRMSPGPRRPLTKRGGESGVLSERARGSSCRAAPAPDEGTKTRAASSGRPGDHPAAKRLT